MTRWKVIRANIVLGVAELLGVPVRLREAYVRGPAIVTDGCASEASLSHLR